MGMHVGKCVCVHVFVCLYGCVVYIESVSETIVLSDENFHQSQKLHRKQQKHFFFQIENAAFLKLIFL